MGFFKKIEKKLHIKHHSKDKSPRPSSADTDVVGTSPGASPGLTPTGPNSNGFTRTEQGIVPNGGQQPVAANGVDHQMPVHHTKVGQPVFVKEHEPRKPTGSQGKTLDQPGQESNEARVRREQAEETAPIGHPVDKGNSAPSVKQAQQQQFAWQQQQHGDPKEVAKAQGPTGQAQGAAGAAGGSQQKDKAGSGSTSTSDAARDPQHLKISHVEGTRIEGWQVVEYLIIAWALCLVLFMWAVGIRPWNLLLPFLFIGMPMGVGYSWVYYHFRGNRKDTSAKLNIEPGEKGLTALAGGVPSWIKFSDREKVKWLNSAIMQIWPYYDKAVCAMIKEQVEPIIEQYKPPIIKRIYFKNLTFGDAPFVVEDVWVEEETKDHVLIEVSLRWAGDANIALAIELPAGGDATRMVPKVSNLHVSAVGRILLAPLLPEIPGFGAAVISLKKPPQIHFKLNFGAALGSSATAKPVQAWLDPFLRKTLADLLVWPNRIVVPILPEEVTGPLDALMLRHKGVMQVKIMEARGLHAADMSGKADPFVEIYTRIQQVEKTAHKKNTLHPEWNERKWLMVQEPTTQRIYLEVYDWDRINIKELATINIVKGITEMLGSTTIMARAAIHIEKYAKHPEQEFDEWHDLGKGDFMNEDGCGSGKGQIRLKLKYMSLRDIYSQSRTATVGAIMLKLLRCQNLPPADPNGKSDPYVVFDMGGGVKHHKQKSSIKHLTLDPEYKESFEWVKVPWNAKLDVEVFDSDSISSDETLGKLQLRVAEDMAQMPNGEVQKTWPLTDLYKDYKRSPDKPVPTITMHIQWVPFDID
jgi:hypothetical protein